MPSSIETTTTGRWNESTSFDATMPMTPRCHPSPATTRTDRAPMSGSVSIALRAAARISCSCVLAPLVLLVQLRGERARLVGHRRVGGQQEPGGDVGRRHAAGGVHAWREHEADVVAVDRLSGQARGVEQRLQPHLVRPARQELEARAWRSPGSRRPAGRRRRACRWRPSSRRPAATSRGRSARTAPARASARRPRPPGSCPGYAQSGRFGLMTASAGGSSLPPARGGR